jgi:peroxiredoxin
LQEQYGAIQQAGVETVALVVAPIETVESWCQRAGIGFPVLADSQHQVSEAYGVYNLLGDRLAAPAVFVIDTDGRIVWGFVGQNPRDYADGQTILTHLP